jgi:hypothetical protein
LLSTLSKFPLVRPIFDFHRTGLFCRNLGILLSAAVPLATTLRILADMMATMGDSAVWVRLVDQVRQGRKLSETLDEASILPPMAIRMLRLGEETGQLPMLAGRVAEFYETKLQRSLDRTRDRGLAHVTGPLGRSWLLHVQADALVGLGDRAGARQALVRSLAAARTIGNANNRDNNVRTITRALADVDRPPTPGSP